MKIVAILFPPAHTGFVDLEPAFEFCLLLPVDLADAMVKIPCGLLSHAGQSGQLDTGDTLLVRGKEKNRQEPFMEGELRLAEDRTRADAEASPALRALEGLPITERIYL